MSDSYYQGAAPSPDFLNRTAWIESRGNPSARTGSSQYRGLYQLGNDQIGDNWQDPTAQNAAMSKVYGQNYSQLSHALGRPPSDSEMYMAHNMGVGGYLARLNNPTAPATDTPGLPASHAKSNPFGIPEDQLSKTSNADYLNAVQGTYDRAAGRLQGAETGQPQQMASYPGAPPAQPLPQQPQPSAISGLLNQQPQAQAAASSGPSITNLMGLLGNSNAQSKGMMSMAQGLMNAGQQQQSANTPTTQASQQGAAQALAQANQTRPLPLKPPTLIGQPTI